VDEAILNEVAEVNNIESNTKIGFVDENNNNYTNTNNDKNNNLFIDNNNDNSKPPEITITQLNSFDIPENGNNIITSNENIIAANNTATIIDHNNNNNNNNNTVNDFTEIEVNPSSTTNKDLEISFETSIVFIYILYIFIFYIAFNNIYLLIIILYINIID
jgi:hypothetical protein